MYFGEGALDDEWIEVGEMSSCSSLTAVGGELSSQKRAKNTSLTLSKSWYGDSAIIVAEEDERGRRRRGKSPHTTNSDVKKTTKSSANLMSLSRIDDLKNKFLFRGSYASSSDHSLYRRLKEDVSSSSARGGGISGVSPYSSKRSYNERNEKKEEKFFPLTCNNKHFTVGPFDMSTTSSQEEKMTRETVPLIEIPDDEDEDDDERGGIEEEECSSSFSASKVRVIVNSNSPPKRKKALKKQMSLCVEDESCVKEESTLFVNASSSGAPSAFERRNRFKSSFTLPANPEIEDYIDRAPPAIVALNIPTLTVTINPLEVNEVTYEVNDDVEAGRRNRISEEDEILDEESALAIKSFNPSRSCSIGSASSLVEDPCTNSTGGREGGLAPNSLGIDLGIRRVSEISHINELRREVSGLDHLASEYYEISHEPNPDSISLDSIHKKVLQRCQNKYIPPQRSSVTNKCFVVVTTGFTLMGIVYGFWYKNFGPGKYPISSSSSSGVFR